MNKDQYKILKILIENNNLNQRKISQLTNFSLGKVNSLLEELSKKKYIFSNYKIASEGEKYINSHHPKQATILALDTDCEWCRLIQKSLKDY